MLLLQLRAGEGACRTPLPLPPFALDLWYFAGYPELLLEPILAVDVVYGACMHGGSRAKAQRLRTSCHHLLALAQRCDASHVHLPWKGAGSQASGRCATADETAYPALFCQRVTAIAHQHLQPTRALQAACP